MTGGELVAVPIFRLHDFRHGLPTAEALVIPIRSIALALFSVTLAAAAQAAASEEKTAEEKLLGAPCRGGYEVSSEAFAATREINRKHDAATKRGDFQAALAMRKELARIHCHSQYLWFYLAELYVELGENDNAIAVLEYLYGKKNNEIDRRLGTKGNALHPLAASQEFQSSLLAKKLAADREQSTRRKQEFQKKLSDLPAPQKPPADYVAKDACPFECCIFRTWDVHVDTAVYDKPNGHTVLGRVEKGDKVEGLTGEVHIRPIPIAVRQPPAYSKAPTAGSIVFLLDSLGEGIGRVWLDGKILELDVSGNIHDHCPFPDKRCWGEYLYPVTQDERWGTWWVKVKTDGGIVGWTKDTENFGNMGGCG